MIFDRGRPPAFVSGPVFDALEALGHATPTQIAAHIGEGVTLKQIRKALSNGIGAKRICSTRFVRQKGIRGGRMATYWLAGNPPPPDYKPKPEPKLAEDEPEDDGDNSWMFKPNRRDRRPSRAFPSVWHYAQGLAASTN